MILVIPLIFVMQIVWSNAETLHYSIKCQKVETHFQFSLMSGPFSLRSRLSVWLFFTQSWLIFPSSFPCRIPMSISSKPRSSRLKDKQKVEGETLVKDIFVKNVAHNSGLLHSLGNGSSVVILPRSSSLSLSSNLRIGSQLNLNSSLGLPNHRGFMKSLKGPVPCNTMSDDNSEVNQNKGFLSVKGKFDFLYERETQTDNVGSHSGSDICGDKLSDQTLFSCVTCGVLSFDCVAIIQPSEEAARYLMSADCSFFNDWIVGSGVSSYKAVLGSRNVLQTSSTSRFWLTALLMLAFVYYLLCSFFVYGE